jgi:glycosyltransferase involved in cell wall biosynthesis
MSKHKINSVQYRIANVVTSADSIKLMGNQLNLLQEHCFDVHLVSSPGTDLDNLNKKRIIKTVAIPMKREINLLHDIISLWKLVLFMIKIRPQLTNVSTPKAGLLAGLAAWLTLIPIRVYTLRGLRLETTTGLKRLLLIGTEWIACACAHQVICISPSLRDRAVSLRIVKAHKAIVLGAGSSNGLDLDKFIRTESMNEEIANIRLKYNIQSSDKVIGYVGRLTKDKGITELVNAFRSLNIANNNQIIKLMLVGYYEDSDRLPEYVLSIIDSDPNIIFTGYVKNSAPYYYVFDVFAFPSHREGFGNVSIEAAAAGKPVVTTNATGAVDTVVHNVTGLIINKGDEKQLADSLSKLLMDPDYAKQLGVNGMERVRVEFSSTRIGNELISQYKKMIEVKWK